MQVQRQFQCSDLQFFNFIAGRIKTDIIIETDRKISLRDLHRGLEYDKKIQLTQKRYERAKARIAVYDKPQRILLEIVMQDGTQSLNYQIQACQDQSCTVTYTEEYHAVRVGKKMQVAVSSPFRSWKNRKRLNEMLDQWEAEIRQLF